MTYPTAHAHSLPDHPHPDGHLPFGATGGTPAPGVGYLSYGRPVAVQPGRVQRLFLRVYARTPNWTAPVAIAACFAGAAGLVWVTNPTDANASDIPTCLVKMTTGFDCPGCGGTRAFYYLLQGNVPEAARHHAMAVFAAPFLVWAYLAWAVKKVSGRAIPAPKITARAISIYLLAWAVFTVLRDLPFAPFTALFV